MSERGENETEGANEGNAMFVALKEMNEKIESSLLPTIQKHVTSKDFQHGRHGLDFLETKNSVLLSYLIELTVHIRYRIMLKNKETVDKEAIDENRKRLMEMKVVLDKMRGLDKKLKYQIDKLLAAGTATAGQFASSDTGPEDPLQFRPNLEVEDDDGSSSSSSDDDSADSGSAEKKAKKKRKKKKKNDSDGEEEDDAEQSDSEGDIDDDLAAARMTINAAKEKDNGDDDELDEKTGLYRAPRLSAVPYTHDEEDKEAERLQRKRRRMRASELAETLRNQYGDAPEQDDVRGGADLGKQREAASRYAQREAEKEKYEEDAFVRLTVTKKEKQEKKRLMRQETSNLAAIADVGNIIKDTDEEFGTRRPRESEKKEGGKFRSASQGRQGSGRMASNDNGRRNPGRAGLKDSPMSRNFQPKVTKLQADLFGGGSSGKKSKKRK